MDIVNLRRPHSLRLLRYQLLGAILVSGLIPYTLHFLHIGEGRSVALLTQTLFIVVLATTLGYWFLRNFVVYPGVEKSSNIITSLSTAYGLVVAVMIFARIEYSRFMLMGGYALSIGWFYYATTAHARRNRFRVGLDPSGAAMDLADISFVTWVPLRDVDAPVSQVDAVAVDLRADLPDRWERALADFALAGIPVYHIKHLKESLTGQVDLEHISENNFGSLSPISAYMTIKHILDWLAAACAMIVIVPVLLLCGLAIKLDSPGPMLFQQRRIGYQGQPFNVYKLRTMTVTDPSRSADRDAAMTKSNDQRVTRVGRFLRQSRLDELPQLINVLRNQMSWIGPRPEAAVLSKWYEDEIPFYRYRHIVRPGITGWAQVNQGHVAELNDVKTKLNFDFYYIKNYSPWLDTLIVARTLRTMVTGFGAR